MHIAVGDVVLLYGELGAGKTAFASGVTEGLGCKTRARSPTFVIMNEHFGRLKLVHCDLYRVQSPDEANELGIHEVLENAALLVEWPERWEEAVPSLKLRFQTVNSPETRIISISASGPRAAILKELMAAECGKFTIAPNRVG